MKLIAAKLTKIMQACSYVQKTGYNDFHKYKYATAAAVLEKANESMVENEVASIVRPEIIEFRDVVNARGATEHLATVKTTVTLIDCASGETIELIGMGSGQDSSDKAIMKAQTAALKYAWMMSLNISTGDDPEADSPEQPPKEKTKEAPKEAPKNTTPEKPAAPLLATEPQRKKIDELRTACGWSTDDVKAEIALTYEVKSSKDLTLPQAKQLIDRLEVILSEKGKSA